VPVICGGEAQSPGGSRAGGPYATFSRSGNYGARNRDGGAGGTAAGVMTCPHLCTQVAMGPTSSCQDLNFSSVGIFCIDPGRIHEGSAGIRPHCLSGCSACRSPSCLLLCILSLHHVQSTTLLAAADAPILLQGAQCMLAADETHSSFTKELQDLRGELHCLLNQNKQLQSSHLDTLALIRCSPAPFMCQMD
jgi:hypothetical protein